MKWLTTRLSLGTKFALAIIGVIILAMSSSLMALYWTREIAESLHSMATDTLPSLEAAEELEIALLEQRGLVSSYILDGGEPEWLDRLEDKKKRFDEEYATAWRYASAENERDILTRLGAVYKDYIGMRDQVVKLYKAGETELAASTLVHEVNAVFEKAFGLCEDYIAKIQRGVDQDQLAADQKTRRATWVVGICVGLTAGLGLVLAWMFFAAVLLPLRKMIADAREFSGAQAENGAFPTDELRTVGAHLRLLMDDVADTRSHLEASRNRLLSAEKLATVGKLAASVAHEMRNPLTAVKMWLFSIRSAVAGDRELDHKLEIISDEILRLESIIRNFLEFSRPPALRLERRQIADLVSKTLDLFRPRIEGRGLRLSYADPGELPPVVADPEQIRQVLGNLLDNATEATPEGGQIDVTTTAERDRDGRPWVVTRIRDTGHGMPEDVGRRIFEPFFTTKDEGTGLGLCIAAQIVARHNGRLVLESSSEQGTTLALWIPTAEAEGDEQNLRG